MHGHAPVKRLAQVQTRVAVHPLQQLPLPDHKHRVSRMVARQAVDEPVQDLLKEQVAERKRNTVVVVQARHSRVEGPVDGPVQVALAPLPPVPSSRLTMSVVAMVVRARRRVLPPVLVRVFVKRKQVLNGGHLVKPACVEVVLRVTTLPGRMVMVILLPPMLRTVTPLMALPARLLVHRLVDPLRLRAGYRLLGRLIRLVLLKPFIVGPVPRQRTRVPEILGLKRPRKVMQSPVIQPLPLPPRTVTVLAVVLVVVDPEKIITRKADPVARVAGPMAQPLAEKLDHPLPSLHPPRHGPKEEPLTVPEPQEATERPVKQQSPSFAALKMDGVPRPEEVVDNTVALQPHVDGQEKRRP